MCAIKLKNKTCKLRGKLKTGGGKSMNPGDEKISLYYSDKNNVNIFILLSIY